MKSEELNKGCFYNRKVKLLEATFAGTWAVQYIHKWPRNSRFSVNTKHIDRGITKEHYNKNPSDYDRHGRANSEG